MKNNIRFKICTGALLAICMTGCNKPFTPPDITGNWGNPSPYINPVQNLDNLHEEDLELKQAVINKINGKFGATAFWDSFKLLLEESEDYPRTIHVGPDNIFSFNYISGYTTNGTYTQDMQTFTFKEAASPNVIYAEFDYAENALWLHLFNKTQEKDAFYYALMHLYDLNEEEEAVCEKMIVGYYIGLIYKQIG